MAMCGARLRCASFRNVNVPVIALFCAGAIGSGRHRGRRALTLPAARLWQIPPRSGTGKDGNKIAVMSVFPA